MGEVERVALRAWPALETDHIGGWEVRFSRGFTKRANSVQPIGGAEGSLRDVVARCEQWYSERGRSCIFRITPLSDPALELHLEASGYQLIETTSVLHRPLTEAPESAPLVEMGVNDWTQLYARLNGLDATARDILHEIVNRIRAKRFLGALRAHGAESPIACGMAVVDRGRVGLFDLVTHPDERRRGHGQRLVDGFLSWGYKQGAQEAYLQVVRANRPAWTLYEKLGFRAGYDYRYQVKELAA